MEYNKVSLSFDSIGKALLTPGIVVENIIVNQDKRILILWLAIPDEGAALRPEVESV